MHHGVTANPRQLASADFRSKVSRGVPVKPGSGHAIGVCMVGPIASADAVMTAPAPSLTRTIDTLATRSPAPARS